MTEIFSFFSLSGSSPNSSPNFYENFGIDLVVCGMGWGRRSVDSINVNGPSKKLQYGVHGLQKELSHQQDTSGNLGCSRRIDWSTALRKNWIFLFEWVLSDVTYASRKSTVGLPGYGMAWHDMTCMLVTSFVDNSTPEWMRIQEKISMWILIPICYFDKWVFTTW